MKVIGLTGGIGSGKTTVMKMFQELDIPVYIADVEAKKLMQTLGILKYELIANFGELAFKNGVLNTSYLAEIVFSDAEKLKKINQIVHPKVRAHFQQFKALQNSNYIIFENAILFENGFDNLCDYIITITAPLEDRIKRVQQRDGLNRAQILSRVNNQWSDEQKIKKSHFIIENSNLKETQKKVLEIHEKLLKFIEINNI
ncbi:MAG: dephospho-CoA kinase [Flavobacteriaceae bacterium]|nr:dephospho-CoA kinase [Flavobacteriaceae bacterium]